MAISKRSLLALTLCLTPLISPSLQAQSPLEKQELVRRQLATHQSHRMLLEGRKAYAKGKYGTAYRTYKKALTNLPIGTATARLQKSLQQHLSDAAVAYGQALTRVGKYQEARKVYQEAIKLNPSSSQKVKRLTRYLNDPIRTNPALSSNHLRNVDQVRRLLYKGEGLYNLGLFDQAEKKFYQVLRIDPYNKASRRWLEKVCLQKSAYYRVARNHTRSHLIAQIVSSWELK